MADNGSGTTQAPNSEPSGALTSQEVARKHPKQGKFTSGINNKKNVMRIDTNKHGIRRETSMAPKAPKRTGRKKV